ncbi:MAG: EAL domain-containing protein [Gemmataceae bacterium]|nr:EAL domain-containing protein [Gemmataceae bacterium]
MPYLEFYPQHNGLMNRIPLRSLPFRVGRSMTCNYVISAPEISKEHAEIFLAGDQYRIRDLNSTNGTFINGYRVSEAPLAEDDIIHVAHEEFRFIGTATSDTDEFEAPLTEPLSRKIPKSIARCSQYLDELLRDKLVRILFQPVVNFATLEPIGFEALARGTHSDLSASPVDLFSLGARCGKVAALSELFRHEAVAKAEQLPQAKYLFLNLHPNEVNNDDCLEHLRQIKAEAPQDRQLVLEIHENSVCEFNTLRGFRKQLLDIGFQVAYDDFGAGQARFLELADIPPDFVKLDMRLVRNIDQAEPRRNLLRALAGVSSQLGIRVIAEGVETQEEALVCRELGCEFGQGYFFGLPKAVTPLKQKDPTKDINVSELRARLTAQSA